MSFIWSHVEQESKRPDKVCYLKYSCDSKKSKYSGYLYQINILYKSLNAVVLNSVPRLRYAGRQTNLK